MPVTRFHMNRKPGASLHECASIAWMKLAALNSASAATKAPASATAVLCERMAMAMPA